MANPHPAGFDPWVVVIILDGASYVFGPFEGQPAARRFRKEYGGGVYPLFGPTERDALDGEAWVTQATGKALTAAADSSSPSSQEADRGA